MCELMGLSFAKPISADFSIREFALRGQENAHGWGLAWYPDRSLTIVKEPIQWRQSKYSSFLETYQGLRSRIYVAHVRHQTTGGAPTHADTHPFARELAGREYCFAHNGTLERFEELPLGRYCPIGSTDSEHLFCHLLSELADREAHLTSEENWRWLHAKLTSLNRMGRLNCLLSDGQRLVCYRDAAGWKGLAIRKVHLHEDRVRSFEDVTLKVELEVNSINRGHIVTTRALTSTGWHDLQPGELMVLEDGMLRFSSHRGSHAE
jgi:predicted glutamine amidotransferase